MVAKYRHVIGTALLMLGCLLLVAGVVRAWTGLDNPQQQMFSAGGYSATAMPVAAYGADAFVNTASLQELTALEGVGEKLAEAIVAERELHGPFFYPEDMRTINGIGEKTLEKLLPLLGME